MAQQCEAWGYHRYWVSEHHSHPSIVGTAPEVLMAAIAARTQRIRLGSAGVMLPHYAPLKVAEQFRVLDALAPGRIDLGVGRAPGSDGRTAQLLNPDRHASENFPQQVMELQAWVTGEPIPAGHPGHGVFAYPSGPTSPDVWMLGSSDYGAQLAAHLGLPYAFAYFITDGQGVEPIPSHVPRCACGLWQLTPKTKLGVYSKAVRAGAWTATWVALAPCYRPSKRCATTPPLSKLGWPSCALTPW